MGCGKKCFMTRKEAKKERKKLNTSKRLSLTYEYFCETCSHWHTTSMTKEEFRNKNK